MQRRRSHGQPRPHALPATSIRSSDRVHRTAVASGPFEAAERAVAAGVGDAARVEHGNRRRLHHMAPLAALPVAGSLVVAEPEAELHDAYLPRPLGRPPSLPLSGPSSSRASLPGLSLSRAEEPSFDAPRKPSFRRF